jgi:CheY-like chemotaxis protein
MDTGIGIKESDKHKLFNSFTQIHSSDARKYGGSGLGLSICQNLLTLMDSEIKIDSTVGVGTSFSFVVWFEVAEESDQNTVDDKQHEASIRLEIIPELLDKRILVVDDDALNLMVAAEIVQKLGLNVSRAKSATEAFTLLEQTQILPDLILMDLQMPDVTGYQAFDILQKDPLWQVIPVVALTANASTLEKKKALAYGMDAFLTKPINPYSLTQTLLKWIPHEDGQAFQIDEEMGDKSDLFDLLKQHLDSAIEIEEKLKLVIDMLGKESAVKLFKSVDVLIKEEQSQLIHQLKTQQKETASAFAHRLKGSLGLYSSTKLTELLLQIETQALDFEDIEPLCHNLQIEFEYLQNGIQAYL